MKQMMLLAAALTAIPIAAIAQTGVTPDQIVAARQSAYWLSAANFAQMKAQADAGADVHGLVFPARQLARWQRPCRACSRLEPICRPVMPCRPCGATVRASRPERRLMPPPPRRWRKRRKPAIARPFSPNGPRFGRPVQIATTPIGGRIRTGLKA